MQKKKKTFSNPRITKAFTMFTKCSWKHEYTYTGNCRQRRKRAVVRGSPAAHHTVHTTCHYPRSSQGSHQRRSHLGIPRQIRQLCATWVEMNFNLPLPPIWVTRYTRPDPRRFSQDFRVTLEITKQLVLLLYICLSDGFVFSFGWDKYCVIRYKYKYNDNLENSCFNY